MYWIAIEDSELESSMLYLKFLLVQQLSAYLWVERHKLPTSKQNGFYYSANPQAVLFSFVVCGFV